MERFISSLCKRLNKYQHRSIKAVRLRLKAYYGQLGRATTCRQKSSPLVPLGLHSLFACLPTIHASLFFFCHTFCKRQKKTFALQPPPPCCTCARKKTNPKLLPRSAARKASRFPHHPLVVARSKNSSGFISLCLRSVHSLHSFRFGRR